MTREEAIERIERFKRSCHDLAVGMPEEPGWILREMALNMALAALRPVSREQVERMRDAAISDLTYIARTYPVDLCDDLVCQYCKHYPNVNTGCPGWTENDCFEWRGAKEG